MRTRLLNLVSVVGLSLAGCAAATAVARAQETDYTTLDAIAERNRQLNLRETELRRRYRDLDLVSSYAAFLEQARSEVLLGQTGLMQASLKWRDSVDRWLGQWQGMVSVTSSLDQSNVERAARDLERLVNQLYERYPSLVDEASKVSAKARRKSTELATRDDLPVALFSDKRAHIEALNQQKRELVSAFAAIADKLAAEHLKAYQDAIVQIKNAVQLKLRAMLLQYPELEQVVRDAEALLELMEAVTPKFSSLKQHGLDLATTVNQDAIFAALATLAAMERSSTELEATIAAAGVNDRLKAFERERLRAVMTEARTHIAERLRSRSKAGIFAAFARDQRRRLTRECRKPEMQAHYDCELLRTLNGLDLRPAAVAQLSERDMEYIEGQILKVARGPSYVRGNAP